MLASLRLPAPGALASLCLVIAACTSDPTLPDPEAPNKSDDQACELTCDEGHSQVDSTSECLQDDAVCYELSACGETIVCTGVGTCNLACDEGHTQIESTTECLQDDAVCYDVTACGRTILCTGPGSCDLSCRDGDEAIDGPTACLQDDAVCYTVKACGETQWCTGPAPAPAY